MKKLAFFLAFVFLFSAASFAEELFRVDGSAEVKVKPDRVVLNFGTETRGKNLIETKKKNEETIKKAIEIAKRFRVSDRNIKTDYVSMHPVFTDYKTQAREFIVRQNLSVTLENISNYDAFLTELIEAGINNVSGVEFQTKDLKMHRDEARRLAIIAAQEKAKFLANAAGLRLGDLANLQESSLPLPHPIFAKADMRNANILYESASFAPDSETAAIAPGEIVIRANVILTYKVK